MSNTLWKKVAIIGYIFMLLIDIVGGVMLTLVVSALFGVTLEDLISFNWAQIFRLPIIVSLLAIWLPLPIGLVWAYSLIDAQRYGWSLVVSILTPLVSLILLALGVISVLAALGDGRI